MNPDYPRPVFRLKADSEDGPGASWSPDGNRILIYDDTSMQLFTKQGTRLAVMEQSVFQAKWSRQGERVLSIGTDGTARLWNGFDGIEILRCVHSPDSVWPEAQWNTDETLLLTRFMKEVCIWQTSNNYRRFHVEMTSRVTTAHWMFDESRILIVSGDGILSIWNAESGQELRAIQPEIRGTRIKAYVGRSNQRIILGEGFGARIYEVWSMASLQREFILRTQPGMVFHQSLGNPMWSADEALIATCSRAEYKAHTDKRNLINIWDAKTGLQVHEFEIPDSVWHFAWSNSSHKLMTGSQDGVARLLDVDGKLIEKSFPHESSVEDFTWLEEDHLLLTKTAHGAVCIWDTRNGSLVFQTKYPGTINSVELNPSQTHLLVSWIGNDIDVYEVSLAR